MPSSSNRPSAPAFLAAGPRAGFTFLELVVVISIIASLAAMGFPAWRYYKAAADRNATIALVQNIATAITQYPVKTWTWDASTTPTPAIRTAFLWDLNHDAGPDCPLTPATGSPKKYYSLDGRPKAVTQAESGMRASDYNNADNFDSGFTGSTYDKLKRSGYLGFYDMVRPTISPRFLKKNRQVIDAWGNPLRIAFAADTYGSSWFGLWSAGPDRCDDTNDDICSWTTSHAQ
jgi:prepilin-type N-terminal cleavage/methylation domain-containing protein